MKIQLVTLKIESARISVKVSGIAIQEISWVLYYLLNGNYNSIAAILFILIPTNNDRGYSRSNISHKLLVYPKHT